MTDIGRIRADLNKSGLEPEEMAVREIGSPEKAATATPYSVEGYLIPYYSIDGKPNGHYRIKLFDYDPKYKQPRDTPNHLYFPRGFWDLANKSPFILLTEGEKKAALSTKVGLPCVGVGGVDSWRNRILLLPEDSELDGDAKKRTKAKLPSGGEVTEDHMSSLATGMQDLIDFLVQSDKALIIVYDTDTPHGTSAQVQRAAASLGFELRFRGVPFTRIRQLMLPYTTSGEKVGLDDYILSAPPTALPTLIKEVLAKPSAFPRHPNVRDFLNKRLQKGKISRKEIQSIAMAVISDLDNDGMRLKNTASADAYYFDRKSHKLIKTQFSEQPQKTPDTPFGQFLYRKYGIAGADTRLVQWIAAQFTGEEPVEDVTPFRVFGRTTADKVLYQISDGQYVEISGVGGDIEHGLTGFKLLDNGVNNILFEAGQVKELDVEKLVKEYKTLCREYDSHATLNNRWAEVLTEVRLAAEQKNQARIIASLIFYTSPWLLRWRGTQLPIEMTLGEAGSGKSTLQKLRLNIVDGLAKLRNAPKDMKDWTASVVNTGGLHIIDNLVIPDKVMRQHLSDEICRIITEPNPSVEGRKYYTNAELVSYPVHCGFGITAIKQPFLNPDILQRSFIIELDKSQDLHDGVITYDSVWEQTQLDRFGGREAWVAFHLYVIHRFFLLVKLKWNHRYQAKHRLVNFEQILMLMAELFGIKDTTWIGDWINASTQSHIVDSDWAFEGLTAFAMSWRNGSRPTNAFTASDIVAWAEANEEFEKCDVLINGRMLGRYMQTHKTMIQQGAKIQETGKQNNRIRYNLIL